MEAFALRTAGLPWGVYRTRRIFSSKGKADRAVERLETFPAEAPALDRLHEMAVRHGREVELAGGVPYVWLQRRAEHEFPTREELLSIAPALVRDKARYGLAWFEERWEPPQKELFR